MQFDFYGQALGSQVYVQQLLLNLLVYLTVPSGGSRIFQRRAPTPKVGAPIYDLVKTFSKTAWKWKNLDPKGPP